MAKLYYSLEGNSLGEFSLDKERITIGRRPSNDIHIDNLAVSGDHAVITTIGNDSFLEDLDSTNGTLVNTKPIKKHVLHHGDVIEFGKYQLKYANLTQGKAPANQHGFENTAVMRPAKPNAPAIQPVAEKAPNQTANPSVNQPIQAVNKENAIPAMPVAPASPVLKAAEPVAAAQILGHLKVLEGANAGQELLLNKALTTLGKPGVQVAVVTKRPHGYFISHVEGEKTPLINGQSIGVQAHALNDHDVIDLIGIKMEFYLA
jgi:pSer/pThr/pTyr-binding forkhead associated (FHA) protein